MQRRGAWGCGSSAAVKLMLHVLIEELLLDLLGVEVELVDG